MNPNRDYWHFDELELAKDCPGCLDFEVCGGLRTAKTPASCLSLCRCEPNAKDHRNSVCTCDPKHLVQRKREVNGWGLDVPKCEPHTPSRLPGFVPLIYGRSGRKQVLPKEAVAVPIHRVYNFRRGKLSFSSREQLIERFLVRQDSKLVLSAVHHDRTIEGYWSHGRASGVAEALRDLRFDLITTPNFSVFADVQRWDNFHNMKRIAICWQELAASGNPTALHVNGRTEHDFRRWADFLIEHQEIASIAFEFQTGAASPARGEWCARNLCSIADKVARPLQLMIFAGLPHVPRLKKSFDDVVLVGAGPSMSAVHRKKLVKLNPGLRSCTEVQSDLDRDRLFQHNIDVYDRLVNEVHAA